MLKHLPTAAALPPSGSRAATLELRELAWRFELASPSKAPRALPFPGAMAPRRSEPT